MVEGGSLTIGQQETPRLGFCREYQPSLSQHDAIRPRLVWIQLFCDSSKLKFPTREGEKRRRTGDIEEWRVQASANALVYGWMVSSNW